MLTFGSVMLTNKLLIRRLSARAPCAYIKSMDREHEYLKNSEWCMSQARSESNRSLRIMLVHIAETWRRLADVVREENPTQGRVLH
jgi:hypothetical protein